MVDHKPNEDFREELGMTNLMTAIKINDQNT
jgi:hypothetical protein